MLRGVTRNVRAGARALRWRRGGAVTLLQGTRTRRRAAKTQAERSVRWYRGACAENAVRRQRKAAAARKQRCHGVVRWPGVVACAQTVNVAVNATVVTVTSKGRQNRKCKIVQTNQRVVVMQRSPT